MPTVHSKFKSTIPPFEEKNFAGWFKQLNAYLRGAEIEGALNERPTAEVDDQGIEVASSAAVKKTLKEAQTKWDSDDSKTFAALFVSCRENDKTKQLCERYQGTTSGPLLVLLRERYQASSERYKNSLYCQLLQFQMSGNEDGLESLDRFDSIVSRIKASELEVDGAEPMDVGDRQL